MGYSREVYEAAQAELARRRARAQADATARHDRVAQAHPRVREIEKAMAQSAIGVARAVLRGGNVTQAVETIKQDNLRLQAELAAILAKEGLPANGLEPRYTCPVCEDTGFVDRHACACLAALLREQACRRLSYAGAMKQASFDALRLDYYPDTPDAAGVVPRARMREVLAYCRGYAEDFDAASPSLLLRGPTGTGKTHVSLAIAHTAIDRGFGVVYGPVQNLLHRLEKEHFGREGGNSEEVMSQCDLLVLDDLGAEFASPFYTSCVYNLINGRMLEGRPTIISTNLNQHELMDRYGEQITSRLVGTFVPLVFVGKDIRQLTLQQRMSGA